MLVTDAQAAGPGWWLWLFPAALATALLGVIAAHELPGMVAGRPPVEPEPPDQRGGSFEYAGERASAVSAGRRGAAPRASPAGVGEVALAMPARLVKAGGDNEKLDASGLLPDGVISREIDPSDRRDASESDRRYPHAAVRELPVAGAMLAVAAGVAFAAQLVLRQPGAYWAGVALFAVAAAIGVPAMRRTDRLMLEGLARVRARAALVREKTARPDRRSLAGALAGLALVAFGTMIYLEWQHPIPNNPLTIGLWLTGLILSVGAAGLIGPIVEPSRLALATEPATRGIPRRLEPLLLAAIVLIAVALRIPDLDALPPSVHMDPAEQGLWGRLVMAGGAGGVFGIGYAGAANFTFALSGLGLRAFGDSITGLRLVSAILGVLSLLLAYLWARQAFGVRVAAISAFLLAASPYHIHFSRDGCFYIQAVFVVALAFVLYWRALRSGRPADFVLTGMSLALCLLVYYAARIAFVVVALFELYRLLAERRSYLRRIGSWLLAAAGFLLLFVPWALQFLRDPGAFMARSQAVLIFSSGPMNHLKGVYHTDDVGNVLLTELQHVLEMFNYRGDTSTQFGWREPFLDYWTAALFVVGIAYAFTSLRQARFVFCTVWFWSVAIVGGMLTGGMPFAPRLIVFLPLLFVFPALVLDRAWLLAESGIAKVRAGGLVQPLLRATPVVGLLVFLALSFRASYVGYFDVYVHEAGQADHVTLLARYLSKLPEGYAVYLIQPDPGTQVLDHATVRFIAPRAAKGRGVEVRDFVQVPPLQSLPGDEGLAVVVYERSMATQSRAVEQAYPDARRYDQRDANGNLAFQSYLIGGPTSGR
jgi:4-amino-4-deoxy-L-arabinose transferase-like glycosyltransferase